ncbi:hypothetical protein [Geochorda subterranea]|uniref:DNA primase/nucleoside triphosphatase C-terminal domain-containing protein n=1 Tax=Geochorda subterranea TaxID=3109564 RepID=A0ABZ1BQ56_9FIRM|nr:hypothetical protein [Limnochorda sp. LNt]WRP14593.1 hypothetical protein VLY81_00020 [Limnochorda sp. LNt]
MGAGKGSKQRNDAGLRRVGGISQRGVGTDFSEAIFPLFSGRLATPDDQRLFHLAILRAVASDPSFYLHPQAITEQAIREALKQDPELSALFQDPNQPKSGPATVEAFIKARVDVGNPKYRVAIKDLYAAYMEFCASKRMVPRPRRIFGHDLRTILGDIKKTRPGPKKGKRPEFYVGIRLRPRSD